MGTHGIFESDFDCLTERMNPDKKKKRKFKPNVTKAGPKEAPTQPSLQPPPEQKESVQKQSTKQKKEKKLKKEVKMVQVKGLYGSGIEKGGRHARSSWGSSEQSAFLQSKAPVVKKTAFKTPGKEELKVELEETEKVLLDLHNDTLTEYEQNLTSEPDLFSSPSSVA